MRPRTQHRAGDPADWPAWVVAFGPGLDWTPAEPIGDPPPGWAMGTAMWQTIRRHELWSSDVRAWRSEHDVDPRELALERRRRWEAWRDGLSRS